MPSVSGTPRFAASESMLDCPELRFWKDKTSRFLFQLAKTGSKVLEWEEPLTFPEEKRKLASFVRTKKNCLKGLQETLRRAERTLERLPDEGASLISKITDSERKRMAQEEFDNFSPTLLGGFDDLSSYYEVLEVRLVELQEQESHLLDPLPVTSQKSEPMRQRQPQAAPQPAENAHLENAEENDQMDSPLTQQPRRSIENDEGESDSDRQTERSEGSEMSFGRAPRHRPKQQLPRFQGDARKFPSFWTAYTAMVHDADDLSDLDKFFYLRQSLREEALRLVEEIPVTAENYPKAVSLLKHRYDLGSSVTTVMIADLQKIRPASESTGSIRETLELLRQKLITLECHGEKFQDVHIWKSLILSKFPPSVNRHIIKEERRLPATESGSPKSFAVKELLEEVADYVLLLECIDLNINSVAVTQERPGDRQQPQSVPSSQSSSKKGQKKNQHKKTWKCVCQATDHLPQNCPKFTSPSSRRQEAVKNSLCWKCFRTGHHSKDCDRLGPCPDCSGDHHRSLCVKNAKEKTSTSSSTQGTPAPRKEWTPSKPKTTSSATACAQEHGEPGIPQQEMLSLADPVQLQPAGLQGQIVLTHVTGLLFNEETNKYQPVNVFIDDGAVMSLIRTATSETHALKTSGPFRSLMSGVGGQIVNHSYNLATAKLRSTVYGEADRILQLRTIRDICQPLQTAQLSEADWNFIRSQGLQINRSSSPRAEVDILIGQDYRQNFVYEEEPRVRLPSGLLLTKTVFGYAVSGCSTVAPPASSCVCLQHPFHTGKSLPVVGVFTEVSNLQMAAPVINKDLEDFKSDIRNLYSLEYLGIRPDKDENEAKALSFMDEYRKSIVIEPGKVIAGFPFLDTVEYLADNFNVAVKQLQHQLRNLSEEHLQLYEKTFEDYRHQGFIEECSSDPGDGVGTFYMPHHAVVCPEKSTSFRVVFNGSSHAKGAASLNDVIFPGYALTALIYDVLLRFRSVDYVMVADIQKAFLQIHLPESHRDVTRFLWRKDHSLPASGSNLKTFRFTRVPFGINASPAILNQVILKHLEMIDTDTSKEIAESIYVDNVLLHACKESDLLEKYKDSKQLFKDIGMRLRDYLSSSDHVNSSIPEEDRSSTEQIKILGIPWSATEDTLTLKTAEKPHKAPTPRTVLSQVNGTCYDPLGLLSPFLVHAKVFLQKIVKQKLKWDERLSQEDSDEWKKIVNRLVNISVTLPRRVTQTSEVAARYLMVFSDSSEKAYGCVVYVTTRTTSGLIYTRLLTAKMKVTPIKELTIPRLELTGIQIAANLTNSVLTSSGLDFTEVHLFSDSTIALAWIKSKRLLPPFVKEMVLKINRVFDRIKESAHLELHHVPTAENVADYATRGLDNTTASHHVWWTGPAWLNQEKIQWPVRHLDPDAHTSCMAVNVSVTAAEGKRIYDAEGGVWPVSRVGSFNKLKRVVAYALRFIQHTRPTSSIVVDKENHKNLLISGQEMLIAERHVILQEQKKIDINLMLNVCRKLNLQTDQHGLLRKHSRLNFSHLTFDEANPVFVPSKSLLAAAIVWTLHAANYHRGVQHLQSLVQQRFWIPGLRKLCEKIVRTCPVCAIYRRPYKYPQLSDLPPERVQRAEPFAFTGTDLFGPLYVKNCNGFEEKRWIALFCCFVTRMVHLEIVQDLSARAYLLALRRFMSRRGVPKKIWSDNGTNFQLTSKLLPEFSEEDEEIRGELASFVANHHIVWTFIPPGAPWMGGSWERMVGLVKKPLLQAIGRRRVTEDCLHTMICEIEAVVNSRPLCFSSEDSTAEVLRPVDFCQPKLLLTGPLLTIETQEKDDPDFLPKPLAMSRQAALKAIEDVESGLDRFWNKFYKDYLLNIKGIFNKTALDYASTDAVPRVGDVVLLDEDIGATRHHWPRGIIIEVLPGKDGAVRSVFVRTPNGHVLRRPVNKLVPLEMSDDSKDPKMPSANPTDKETPKEKELPTRRQPLRQAKKNVNYKEPEVVAVSTGSRLPLRFTWMLPIVMCFMVASTSALTPSGFVTCAKGGVLLNIDHQTDFKKPVTAELCVNLRSCTTLLLNKDQMFYVSPIYAIADYKVQWRTLQGSTQILETVTCPGTPNCDLIDCWICAKLVGNPHCWPQAAIFAAALWSYVALATCYIIWRCCFRRCFKDCCRKNLERTAFRLQDLARRRCRARRNSTSTLEETEDLLPLVVVPNREVARRNRLAPSRIVTEFTVVVALTLLILPFADACQRISVVDSSMVQCSEGESLNNSCHAVHTVTASLSELRRDMCIRSVKDTVIQHELKLHFEEVQLYCRPVVQFYTRNVELRTHSVKRCAFAGSCSPSFCSSVSSRTVIPELDNAVSLPGISRCSTSCGGLVCGCALPVPGCLFSRTVAEPVDEDVYVAVTCPIWSTKVALRVEETFHNGTTRSASLRIKEQGIASSPSINVTVDFVANPPLPILSSLFLKKISNKMDDNTALLAALHSDIALQCPSKESALQPSTCFLRNTCFCSPSINDVHCDCHTLNISRALQSLDSRLPITTSEVALNIQNGLVVAVPHVAVAEVTLVSRFDFNTAVVSTTRCSIVAQPVEGCFNCISGARSTATCTSDLPTVATVTCTDHIFALPCNSSGAETILRLSSAVSTFEDTCVVSCSNSNVSLHGILLFPSLTNDLLAPEEKGHYVNFWNLPEVSNLLAISGSWWKTTILALLLPVAAVGAIVFAGPFIVQMIAFGKLKRS